MAQPHHPYLDEFRSSEFARVLSEKIREAAIREIRLMEVCGGHTHTIHRYGLPGLLPPTVRLLSGPGCPVGVTGQAFVDRALAISATCGVILATYGDLIRVPGNQSSLEKERSSGRDIRIVYSVLDALELAKSNPENEIVFLGIGFETTAPATAAAVVQAREQKVHNFSVLSAHKVMPPALEALANSGVQVDGFIAPGHVTAITGTGIYKPLSEKYGKAVVVSGFEPADVMMSVLMLVRQVTEGRPGVENQYRRAVREEGNRAARRLMERVFVPSDAEWRGLGIIAGSGLTFSEEFRNRDAEKKFPVPVEVHPPPAGCLCGEILTGAKTPRDCALFSTVCTPMNPVGACMVSGEGACSIYYRYKV